ncbi:protein rep, partial [Staphylococcus aureus]|nr:protein rep [Staphylococcus aureus]MCQ6698967.1 protein rep [Staphylococcus aureus]MCQ6701987.1 protein rep [Staphylococcus aureus]MCQ6704899.1 protein rep [Staphylococcus aureus]
MSNFATEPNVSYADILEILKIKKAYNVKQCGNVLEFK